MIGRYRDGVVPPDQGRDDALATELAERQAEIVAAFDAADITRALEAAWVLVRALNRLVEQRAPWVLAKDPAAATELDQALFSLAAGLKAVTILLWPFIPASAERALASLGQDPTAVGLDRAAWGDRVAGARVTAVPPLFPRVEGRPE